MMNGPLMNGAVWRVLIVTLIVLPLARVWAEPPPLIPRALLFSNPERDQPRLSPDGKRIAWLAPDKNNVLQVWVGTLGRDDDQVVTAEKKRGIERYAWAGDSATMLYLQDQDGDGNWHLYGVDLESRNIRDYTPFQGVGANLVDIDPGFPDQVLVGLSLRKRELVDVYRLNLHNGALELDTGNPGDVIRWVADAHLVVRGASNVTPDGGTELRVRDGAGKPWRTLLKAGPEDSLSLEAFSADGRSVVLRSSLGSDTERVVERDLQTGAERVLAEHPKVDTSNVWLHPVTHRVQAVAFEPGRREWKVLDPSVRADFETIARLEEGNFEIISRDRADATWLVSFERDRGGLRYYTWDRKAKKGTFLFTTLPKLDSLTLAEVKPVELPARDGLVLGSYLTLPPGVPATNLPMVLLVHGGPWGRDSWGFDPFVQWLANRGYAVLQVNFRGSAGFGKGFLSAGYRQWGLKMQDDLIDGVEWAVKQGLADPKRVAIVGASYGGYAALAGAAFTPDVFRCAVDMDGPSNLFTLLDSVPPIWKPRRAWRLKRVGNPDDPEDRELLRKSSPLFSADRIKVPVLIGQGGNDPVVKPAESEQIVEALARSGKKATYVLYPDEGHGVTRPENLIDFNARIEAFLAENLGGRKEPLTGEKYPGSTGVVRVVGGSAPSAAAGAK